MSFQTKNVFISHIHEDDPGLEKVKKLLAKNGMQIRDSSINSNNPNNAKSPEYIKSDILAPAINWAGTFIVYVSKDTKNSQWVEWEIEYAHQKKKPVIGIWEPGSTGCELPAALDKFGDAVVTWDSDKLIDAINGDCRDWKQPNGEEFPNRRIKPHRC